MNCDVDGGLVWFGGGCAVSPAGTGPVRMSPGRNIPRPRAVRQILGNYTFLSHLKNITDMGFPRRWEGSAILNPANLASKPPKYANPASKPRTGARTPASSTALLHPEFWSTLRIRIRKNGTGSATLHNLN